MRITKKAIISMFSKNFINFKAATHKKDRQIIDGKDKDNHTNGKYKKVSVVRPKPDDTAFSDYFTDQEEIINALMAESKYSELHAICKHNIVQLEKRKIFPHESEKRNVAFARFYACSSLLSILLGDRINALNESNEAEKYLEKIAGDTEYVSSQETFYNLMQTHYFLSDNYKVQSIAEKILNLGIKDNRTGYVYFLKGLSFLSINKMNEAKDAIRVGIDILKKFNQEQQVQELESSLFYINGLSAYYLNDFETAKKELNKFCINFNIHSQLIRKNNLTLAKFYLILIAESENSPLLKQKIREFLLYCGLKEQLTPLQSGCLGVLASRSDCRDMLSTAYGYSSGITTVSSLIGTMISADKNNSCYLRLKAHAAYRVGKYQEAITVAESAIKLNKYCGESYFYKGQAHQALGDMQLANIAFQKAFSLIPEHQNARESQKNLWMLPLKYMGRDVGLVAAFFGLILFMMKFSEDNSSSLISDDETNLYQDNMLPIVLLLTSAIVMYRCYGSYKQYYRPCLFSAIDSSDKLEMPELAASASSDNIGKFQNLVKETLIANYYFFVYRQKTKSIHENKFKEKLCKFTGMRTNYLPLHLFGEGVDAVANLAVSAFDLWKEKKDIAFAKNITRFESITHAIDILEKISLEITNPFKDHIDSLTIRDMQVISECLSERGFNYVGENGTKPHGTFEDAFKTGVKKGNATLNIKEISFKGNSVSLSKLIEQVFDSESKTTKSIGCTIF